MKIQRTQCFKGVMAAVATAALFSISSAQGRYRDRDIDAFNTTMEGRGSARVNGQSYNFDELQVTLQNNERVTVHALLHGRDSRDIVMTGKLRNESRRSGRLYADIDSVAYGRDFDHADADCTIDMSSDERFSTVTVRGRNTSDRNSVSLSFTSSGRVVRGSWNDRDRDWDRDWDHDNRRRSAAGRYTDADEWRRRGEHFLVRYNLELDRNGHAKMVVKSEEDRNMPDDRNARYGHGDILNYLQRGHDIVQTGRWTQDGNRVTITFDRMEYGRNRERSNREVIRGTLRNGTIWIQDYDKDFYGHRVEMTFEPRNIFR